MSRAARNFKGKLIIVINGKGGCGKDTLVGFAKDEFSVWNISSIDPIKKIASQFGYKEEKKDEKSRKFLSDLKKIFVDWDDIPVKYLMEKVKEFLDSDSHIMFVHIRERDEILKFHRLCDKLEFKDLIVKNLFITNPFTDNKRYGNNSDDDITSEGYDFIYENSKPLHMAKYDFLLFFEGNFIPYIDDTYAKMEEYRKSINSQQYHFVSEFDDNMILILTRSNIENIVYGKYAGDQVKVFLKDGREIILPSDVPGNQKTIDKIKGKREE